MDYIKEAEQRLKDYAKLKKSIVNLNTRKKRIALRNVPNMPGAIDYSKPAVQKHSYSDNTLNEMIEIIEINKAIENTENEIKLEDDILADIKKEETILEKFLRIKYIEQPKISMRKLATELGYSEESNHTIYDIKKKALREFAIRYYGVEAQKNT